MKLLIDQTFEDMLAETAKMPAIRVKDDTTGKIKAYDRIGVSYPIANASCVFALVMEGVERFIAQFGRPPVEIKLNELRYGEYVDVMYPLRQLPVSNVFKDGKVYYDSPKEEPRRRYSMYAGPRYHKGFRKHVFTIPIAIDNRIGDAIVLCIGGL